MNNYFRITAYHPAEDLSVIADSNGKFEKLWEFSAYMVSKGFNVIAVNKEDSFEIGNIPKIAPDKDKITIQAYASGKPKKTPTKKNNINVIKIKIETKTYVAIK